MSEVLFALIWKYIFNDKTFKYKNTLVIIGGGDSLDAIESRYRESKFHIVRLLFDSPFMYIFMDYSSPFAVQTILSISNPTECITNILIVRRINIHLKIRTKHPS